MFRLVVNNIEVWRPVVGYEGRYEVSNFGNIHSLSRQVPIHHNAARLHKGKTLKGEISKPGYVRVCLGDKKKHLIHRLVAQAFLPNSDNLPCVNHKDENKLNNFVFVNPDGSVDPEKSNLEWCTTHYNNLYKDGMVRRLETRKKRGTKKTDPKPIFGIPVKGGSMIRFESGMEAVRSGFHNVHLVLEGNRPTCKGYKWYYE